ncbi:C_GCAxxG_C_C family protein [Bacteroides sp. 214]|uniref:C-GCAxxG-C-C family protein n=1 Tax=Bacteroides sp. 214 TaxID=2302935 RepID=UPI0013D2F6DA|nr:C-GCAxxG-C-C family protein [Bacteroides sp. 214]NDW13611.1 C_GCAxxG_C_C family protein [Bacteroides sp. 214]
MEKRVERAAELYESGYNCSQAVTAAFADMYGFSEEQALRMSASFGGGIGQMRKTCGAACGMFILAGLETGTTIANDKKGKAENYMVVQDLADEFIARNGALSCGDLRSLPEEVSINASTETGVKPCYKKRPCKEIVIESARIWIDFLSKRRN